MSWYQQRVFCQSRGDEPLAAGQVDRGIGPCEHPCWLLDLNNIMKEVNDYQREVFNRDIGTITLIDLEEQEVVVQFTEKP
jgi:ATP-dependent exoDNAse (exonuclease V) alpha subunit